MHAKRCIVLTCQIIAIHLSMHCFPYLSFGFRFLAMSSGKCHGYDFKSVEISKLFIRSQILSTINLHTLTGSFSIYCAEIPTFFWLFFILQFSRYCDDISWHFHRFSPQPVGKPSSWYLRWPSKSPKGHPKDIQRPNVFLCSNAMLLIL